jgi:type II secretory pathway predicted ATPase ExeA
VGEHLLNVSPAEIFARPTADRIWLGPSQLEALSQLSGATRSVLLGPASSGKSTLVNYLAGSLESALVLRLCGPLADAGSVLVQLLQSVELSPWGLSEVEQRSLFSVFALQRRAQGLGLLVIVDKAERLAPAALDEIQRLALIRYRHKPALRWLYCADSVQGEKSALNAVLRETRATYRLQALTDTEVAQYIVWRLQSFGLTGLFSDAAIRVIAAAAQGRFTAVDILSQMSLLLLRKRGHGCVDARLAQHAATDLAERHSRSAAPTGSADGAAEPRSAALPVGRIIASRDREVIVSCALGKRVLIGRSEHNDLCLPSPYLSRHHAVIVGTSDGYYIVDLNSVNGLLLNGALVRRAILRPGDVLRLGPFRLKIELSASAQSDPIPAGAIDDTFVMPQLRGGLPPVRVIK